MIVLLDAGPLAFIINPTGQLQAHGANQWLRGLLAAGATVVIPEIAAYEVRRGLLRIGDTIGVSQLDSFATVVEYVPLTTDVMRTAADLWARARRIGRTTAADPALDCDVILTAQAQHTMQGGQQVVIATTNVKHLGLFAEARHWRDIRPE